jgi:16S rRNA C967 or C1407 C5-methylase (RsmB/RsmF family)
MIATIRALNFWHNHFREDFRFNPEVIVKLREFEDLVKNEGLENFLKIDQTADDRWGRSNSLKTPQHHIIRRPSLGFDSIPPEELSEILGSLDYKLFRRIPLEYQEIIQFIWFISQA